MTRIQKNEVNNIAECNLIHAIINPSKRTKDLNSHYSPFLHECANNKTGRVKFKNFFIILDNGCISMIVMERLVERLCPENMLRRSGTHKP